jgi:hypothetical protein
MEVVRHVCYQASPSDSYDARPDVVAGRPSTARREDRIHFWKAIAPGVPSDEAVE